MEETFMEHPVPGLELTTSWYESPPIAPSRPNAPALLITFIQTCSSLVADLMKGAASVKYDTYDCADQKITYTLQL